VATEVLLAPPAPPVLPIPPGLGGGAGRSPGPRVSPESGLGVSGVVLGPRSRPAGSQGFGWVGASGLTVHHGLPPRSWGGLGQGGWWGLGLVELRLVLGSVAFCF
jgi:hypothetical protein